MIREMRESDLSQILEIQKSVYAEDLIESLESINSKITVSPASCFVCVENKKIISYCLAYPYQKDDCPPLNHILKDTRPDKNIFLHDLAVEKSAAGSGVATKMISHLFHIAQNSGARSITLMAVQDSVPFWQKFGFTIVEGDFLSSTYGAHSRFMMCDHILAD